MAKPRQHEHEPAKPNAPAELTTFMVGINAMLFLMFLIMELNFQHEVQNRVMPTLAQFPTDTPTAQIEPTATRTPMPKITSTLSSF